MFICSQCFPKYWDDVFDENYCDEAYEATTDVDAFMCFVWGC